MQSAVNIEIYKSNIFCISTILSRSSSNFNVMDSLANRLINAYILFYGLKIGIKIIMGLYLRDISYFIGCMGFAYNGFRLYLDVLAMSISVMMINFTIFLLIFTGI